MADVEFVTPGPAVTAATPHSRGAGRPPADDEDRCVVGVRLSDGGCGVRHARPRRDCRDAALARDLRPPLGREGGGLFVPEVDDPDAVLLRAHEHGPDMSAVQGEEMTHTGSFESQCDQLAGIARIRHSATAQGMAEVLNAAWGEPSRPMRITPPEAWSALPR